MSAGLLRSSQQLAFFFSSSLTRIFVVVLKFLGLKCPDLVLTMCEGSSKIRRLILGGPEDGFPNCSLFRLGLISRSIRTHERVLCEAAAVHSAAR
jgi:hypothetical protein